MIRMPRTRDRFSIKVILLGGSYVGKTSIFRRFSNRDFTTATRATIGADFVVKDITVDAKAVTIHLWDTAFTTRCHKWLHPLLETADGFILIFDSTEVFSLADPEHPCNLLKMVEELGDTNAEVLLVSSKCDMAKYKKEEYTYHCIQWANTFGIPYLETSAKTGKNINEAFELIVRRILLKMALPKANPELPDSVKAKEKTKKLLQANFNKAKQRHGTVPVRFLKLFFTGSGASGKTSFVKLLLKKKINKDHHSTNVVHSNHAVSVKMAAFKGSPEKVMWVELGPDTEISFLRSVLLPTKPLQPSEVTATNVPAEKSISTTPTALPQELQYSAPIQQNVSIKQWFGELFAKPVKCSNLFSFQSILSLSAKSCTFTHQPGEVLNIINLLDTGGQPQYIHLLPTINIYPTVTFVVHDLSKSLDDQVLVEYSQHGKHMFTPYHLSYSNLDMIKLLMSSANEALERSPPKIPHLVTTDSVNKRSYICLVGTHTDKVSNEVTEKTANQLSALVDKTQCKAAVWQTEGGNVLFAVNNTTAGYKYTEDPLASTIRSRIETVANEKEVHELPITWMLLELEIRKHCAKIQKSYISFGECVTLARDTGLISDPEEVKSVLLYHHLLGVLIYFAEVPGLCDYVIIDHQWWFDKLSSIICVTFQQALLDRQAVQKLKYEGLFSKDLLQHTEWKDDIKEKFFLSLLVHMKIIAPLINENDEEEEYFMPFVLPAFTLQQRDDILSRYGDLLGQPLLVQFRSGILPRGLFCSLIVELLQYSPKDWHPHFSHDGVHHTFSNLITFSLPDGYSLSLFDKVSYLEVQMRKTEEACQDHICVRAYNYLVYALTEVCIHLNFDYERLQYGFLCQCGKTTEDHIAVLPETISTTTKFAECSIDSLFRLKLTSSQLTWFSYAAHLPTSNDLSSNMQHGYPPADKTADQRAIKRPAMRLLHEVVIPRIAADWSLVADYLEYEVEDKKLIREKCHRDPLKCCVELLEDWLSSDKGVSPKCWSKLIEVLRQIKSLKSTTEKIVEDLAKAGVFV